MQTSAASRPIDFEALWESAEQPVSQVEFQDVPMTSKEVPEFLMPESLLRWLEQIADQCFKLGLIDDAQHGQLIRGGREQMGVFAAIDSDKLRDALVDSQIKR